MSTTHHIDLKNLLSTQHAELLKRFDDVCERLAALEGSKPRKKRNELVDQHGSRTEARVAAIERIFWNLVNSSREKRRDSYRFPKCLIESLEQPHIEAVVVSVLVNQVSLRKVFQTRGPHDPAGETAAQCVRRHLDKTNLVLLRTQDTKLAADSHTLVAFSPGEAIRQAKSYVELPEVWKGWSCEERALPVQNPFGPGFIEPWPDPSDEGRVEEQPVEEETDNDFLEEEEPEEVEVIPVKKSTVTGIDFGGGYSTRVQFPEDED